MTSLTLLSNRDKYVLEGFLGGRTYSDHWYNDNLVGRERGCPYVGVRGESRTASMLSIISPRSLEVLKASVETLRESVEGSGCS